MSNYGYARESIAELKDVPELGRFTSIGRVSFLVESIPRWYTFDPNSSVLADDLNVVEPNIGTGRWIGHGTGVAGTVTIFKDGILQSADVNAINFNGSNIETVLSDNDTRINITVLGGSSNSVESWEDLFVSLDDWEALF
jgi:hypothetical protein